MNYFVIWDISLSKLFKYYHKRLPKEVLMTFTFNLTAVLSVSVRDMSHKNFDAQIFIAIINKIARHIILDKNIIVDF